MPTKIEPTVGRVVWYWASLSDKQEGEQPQAATVAYVHSDGKVNLDITDHDGDRYSDQGVVLVQEGEDSPADEGFCEWMPYQIGQAKKHAE